MQHLWTAITTMDTVTHDAGGPEWLDLPITGYTVRASLGDEVPVEEKLDPVWLLRSNWLPDETDIGRRLVPFVEFIDPLGEILFADTPETVDEGEVYSPQAFSSVPMTFELPWEYVWYTVPGAYTFTVRWSGSRTTREVGRLSLMMEHLEGGALYE